MSLQSMGGVLHDLSDDKDDYSFGGESKTRHITITIRVQYSYNKITIHIH